MSYPNKKTYEKLYYRFLLGDRSNEMLDIAGDISGKVFLDICCGGGRLTKEAISRNTRRNIMIDQESAMIDQEFKSKNVSNTLIMPVENALMELRKFQDKIDVAMCQQGINYWLTESKAEQLSLTMSEGGIFVFNTFNKKPSEKPKVKEYYLIRPYAPKEDYYTEITWLVKDKWFDVNHVQICQGEEPHFTRFKWMSEEYFKKCLDKYFTIDIIREDRTDIYRCIKK
jgi:16S rRNA G966 N2-methylase RsmD